MKDINVEVDSSEDKVSKTRCSVQSTACSEETGESSDLNADDPAYAKKMGFSTQIGV
jgi:hypothetical protein